MGGLHRAPPPAVAAAGGFVAVKVVQSRLADVNPTRISHELNAHVAMCRAEQETPGARHFVKLIDAYARPSEEIDFKLFMVQELCLGTLADRLAKAHDFPDSAALQECERVYIAHAAARALSFMHASPILHRDVRPSNVFFGVDGAVLLGDFGLSVRAPGACCGRLRRPKSLPPLLLLAPAAARGITGAKSGHECWSARPRTCGSSDR